MSAETISREAASRINPIIGSLFTEDTLEAASSLLKSVDALMLQLDDIDVPASGLYPLFSIIAAAIDYEKENPRLSGCGRAKQIAST
ncbi:hypothetical protein [Propionivibrio sp.]|uniref:hypothetical protein n=1 Tax=Propionivibrio sp. TaxID=2212460 RepID=UPI00262801EA|nr:hypothetical protein [Propionivibrio sp.]